MIEDIKKKSKEETNFLGYGEHTHPAFGMVGIAHISGNATLVGSSVQHQHFVALTVSEARKNKDSYKEHWFATRTLCEINLSHAQLAEMLFNSNRGDGVPCTIVHCIGDSTSRRPDPPFESPFKEGSDNLKEALHNTFAYAKELATEAENLARGGLNKKAERDRLAFLAMKIAQDIELNLVFASKCMDEKMEKTVAHAKAEIESFVNLKFQNIGIEQAKAHPELLTSEKLVEGKI